MNRDVVANAGWLAADAPISTTFYFSKQNNDHILFFIFLLLKISVSAFRYKLNNCSDLFLVTVYYMFKNT